MKFITEEIKTELSPILNNVAINQFFVDKFGNLCQKVTASDYTTIANSDGIPLSYGSYKIDRFEKIRRILPKVIKIEF